MQEYPQDHWRMIFKSDSNALCAFDALWRESLTTTFCGKPVRAVKQPDAVLHEKLAIQPGYVKRTFMSNHVFVVSPGSMRGLERHGYFMFETEGEAQEFARRLPEKEGVPGSIHVVGRYGSMKEKWDLLERVARVGATLLLQGESGSGKEVAAKYYHLHSQHRTGPFVPVNCGAIPENLIESELFGHERGAFTGAVLMRRGAFELADGGTIFLDEISELPLHQQVKLLRVLQEGEFMRVGGARTMQVNVQVVAATNKDISAAAQMGQFRQDLYYRLNVIKCVMPPLRDRRGDIEDLVSHFLSVAGAKFKTDVRGISAAAMEKLQGYSWPGNARELNNVIERALILGFDKEILDAEHFEIEVETPQPPVLPSGMTMREIEKRSLLETLKRMNGNRTHTAKALGISVRTVRNRLRKYKDQA